MLVMGALGSWLAWQWLDIFYEFEIVSFFNVAPFYLFFIALCAFPFFVAYKLYQSTESGNSPENCGDGEEDEPSIKSTKRHE